MKLFLYAMVFGASVVLAFKVFVAVIRRLPRIDRALGRLSAPITRRLVGK